MTPSARLSATLEILDQIETTPRPADALTSAYFRARRYIGSKDRGAISALLYAVLRHQARLDWWLEKSKITPSPRGRFLSYLRLVEKMTVKEIVGLCDGKKFAPAMTTLAEEKYIEKLKGHTLIHPSMPEAVLGECPAWAIEGLKARFGKKMADELQALLEPAPLDLRANTMKITRDDALAELKKLGLKAEKTPYSPFGIRVKERPSLGEIALLKQGAIEIQDEGSQLVALALAPKPGERVVDFCAGAGGKTLAISMLMKNKGHIIACDVLENRLKRSTERFRRAGFHNIETKPLKSERDPWVKHHKEKYDRVLVDAPCSGTGTWRRNPDSRWRGLGPGLEALLPLQASILDSACRLVRPGGRLVYATCSLLPEENEKQIERFLDNHPDFKLVPIQQASPDLADLPKMGDTLSLSPAAHGTDGFFAAVMERTARNEGEKT